MSTKKKSGPHEIGAPYVVIDENGEAEFCHNYTDTLKRVETELRDSDGVDGFKVAVYKRVKLYVFDSPEIAGRLVETK